MAYLGNDPRELLQNAAVTFGANALFPRLSYRMRWPTRLGPRGLAVYIAFRASLLFAVLQVLMPFLRQLQANRERTQTALREELGREPTEEELDRALAGEITS